MPGREEAQGGYLMLRCSSTIGSSPTPSADTCNSTALQPKRGLQKWHAKGTCFPRRSTATCCSDTRRTWNFCSRPTRHHRRRHITARQRLLAQPRIGNPCLSGHAPQCCRPSRCRTSGHHHAADRLARPPLCTGLAATGKMSRDAAPGFAQAPLRRRSFKLEIFPIPAGKPDSAGELLIIGPFVKELRPS